MSEIIPTRNPYIFGAPISGEIGFYGREDIFDFVRTTLSSSNQNVVALYGQRRIGKTSILHQLPRHLPLEFIPIYFDLHGQEGLPLPDVLYDLARRIARVLELPTPEKSSFRWDGSFFQSDFLAEALAKLGQRRLVFLLDEFDALKNDHSLPREAYKTFFPYLEQLIHDRPELAFVLAIGRHIDELPSRLGPIYKIAKFRSVSRLSTRDARRLVTEPADGMLQYEDGVIDRILALTANHPYFTQLLCSVIFEHTQQDNSDIVTVERVSDIVTVERVNEAIEDALEQGAGGFGWIWDGLPAAERVVSSAIASIADELGAVNSKQLRQVLEEHNLQLLGFEFTNAPQNLVELDILETVRGDGFRFVVDLVCRWVYHQHPLERATRDLGQVSHRAKRLYENAREAYLAGDYELAINDYRETLIANPNHPWAPLGLAQALYAAEHLEESVDAFEQAFERGDESARDGLVEAVCVLATRYASEEKWNEAVQFFDRALTLRPDRNDIRKAKLEAKLAQATLLKEADHLPEAIDLFREIIREDRELEDESQR